MGSRVSLGLEAVPVAPRWQSGFRVSEYLNPREEHDWSVISELRFNRAHSGMRVHVYITTPEKPMSRFLGPI